jgi:hypothetical protein
MKIIWQKSVENNKSMASASKKLNSDQRNGNENGKPYQSK